MQYIAYFGGSFDPIHRGHLAIAACALSSGRTHKVLLAPAYTPPHKRDRMCASYSDRLAMVRLAAAENDASGRIAASDFEGRLGLKASYSLDVLRALRAELGSEWRIQMLLGADSVAQLHLWSRPLELLEEFDFLVFNRRGSENALSLAARHFPAWAVEKLSGSQIETPFFEISSTEIRNQLAKNALRDNIIPGTVLDYITMHHLYQTSRD